MTNYYTKTIITARPDNFRVTDAERICLELMGFTIYVGQQYDHIYAPEYCQGVTLATIREWDANADAKENLTSYLGELLDKSVEDLTDHDEATYLHLFRFTLGMRYLPGNYIQVSQVLTCDKMAEDGFWGYAAHITSEGYTECDTESFLRKARNAQ